MISAILVLNSRGNVVISRSFRDDIDPRTIASAFRSQIIATKLVDRSPVKTVGSISFLFIRYEDMYIVAATKQNVNSALVFQFLYKLVQIFRSYFAGQDKFFGGSDKFTEEQLKENFALVYELLDEILDFGYPQNCEPDVLKSYITTGGMKEFKPGEISEAMKTVTGAVNWRKQGLKYRKNEVFIDVIEKVNLLLNPKGTVLSGDVSGQIMLKAYLSGMPECKLGLNDKLMMEGEKRRGPKRAGKEIAIDDVTFHQCVRLGKFDTDRTISFVPPDGEFELMRYRITENIVPPFRVVSPIVREIGKTRLEVQITVKSVFNERLYGKNVVVKIPVPKNTAKCKMSVTSGSAKYKPELNSIVWSIKKFPGQIELNLAAEVELIVTTAEGKKWSRPPISLDFTVPMFTASGLHVRFLKVFEKSNYQAVKWVRYITQGGSYEQRI